MTRPDLSASGPSFNFSDRAPGPSVVDGPTVSAIAFRMGWAGESTTLGDLVTGRRPLLGEQDSAAERLDDLRRNVRETGNVLPIQARASGEDTAVVAVSWLDEQQAVFARADSGITGPHDLRGKRLALPLRDALSSPIALRGLLTALELGGIRARHAELVDSGGEGWHGGASDLDALLAGTADVVFVRGAAVGLANSDRRFRQVVNLSAHPDPLARLNHTTLRALTVRRSFLHAHPDVVVEHLSILLRTAAWAQHHHDDVVHLLSCRTGDPEPEDLLIAHGPDLHRALAPTLDEVHVRALDRQKDFLRDWQFLTADFSVTNWIVAEPLAAARDLARRLPPLIEDRYALAPSLASEPGDRSAIGSLPSGW
ncbi:MAG TPA: ABC transporter substrate-binding protein [Polyangia bacterium]|nr:ABC transporter substrate-binding protein [Polyangia bacterium]